MVRNVLWWALVGILVGGAVDARADEAACREWQEEHCAWKAETLRRSLVEAPRPEVEAALFELLQREAFLTACDMPVDHARSTLVGWRLVGRPADEYGDAVLESILVRSGLDLDLRASFEPQPSNLRSAAR